MCPLTYRGHVVGVLALQRVPHTQTYDEQEFLPKLHWERCRHDQLKPQNKKAKKKAFSRQLYSSSSSSESEADEDEEEDRHRMDKRSRRLLTYMCSRLHLQLAQASNLAAVLHVATHTVGMYFANTGRKGGSSGAGKGVIASRKVLLAEATSKADALQQEQKEQLRAQAAVISKREASVLKYKDQVVELAAEKDALSQQLQEMRQKLRATKEYADESVQGATEKLKHTQMQARQQTQAALDRAEKAEQELQLLRKRLQVAEAESAARYQMLQNARPVLAHAKELEADFTQQQNSISELESAMRAAQELLQNEEDGN